MIRHRRTTPLCRFCGKRPARLPKEDWDKMIFPQFCTLQHALLHAFDVGYGWCDDCAEWEQTDFSCAQADEEGRMIESEDE